MTAKAPLFTYRANVYSQFGEDGILAEIFRRIGTTNRYFCEFGAWDGKYLSNCRTLLESGWSGLMIETDRDRFTDLERSAHEFDGRLTVMCRKVDWSTGSPSRLDALLRSAGAPRDFDVLSIDVDGFDYQIPPAPIVDDIPLYAFDMHTRIGKRAIRVFAKENLEVRACLEEYVPKAHLHRAACNAAFYADAAPISPRLDWSQSKPLEQLGMENELLLAQVAPEGILPLVETVRNNLDHLNHIRAQLFRESRGSGSNPSTA